MRMYSMNSITDLIEKKQHGEALDEMEISRLMQYISDGSVPDYQLSAFLMAVFFKGMTDDETYLFTDYMAHSGETADLSGIKKKIVDKHSTGGVGDKTSLISLPMVAAAGKDISIAKMSGRGLGHTGGTLDKLESIPGVNTSLTKERFIDIVKKTGFCIAGQTGAFVPADKKLYSLRDVTSTVDSIPLIASSIMGKKLASGSDCIVLDVKCGSGAFSQTSEKAEQLARLMVAIGVRAGRRVSALITNMDIPLGRNIGNSLEIIEAVEVLDGRGDPQLAELSVTIAANMLYISGADEYDDCVAAVKKTIADGSAKEKLAELISELGGDRRYIEDTDRFEVDTISALLTAPEGGYISSMNAEMVGKASVALGAGRLLKDDVIDMTAGIVLHKTVGDYVNEGEPVATLYSSDMDKAQAGIDMLFRALSFSEKKPKDTKLILKTIGGKF